MFLKLKNVHPGIGGVKSLQERREFDRMFVKDEKIVLLRNSEFIERKTKSFKIYAKESN